MTKTKTIIGLTGNIATGKSVLRRMLTNAGALGIDADVVAHRLYYKDGPAYTQVIDTFGERIISKDGQISRQKLGQIVFSNSEKLRTLEALLHPLVIEAIQDRIDQSHMPIIAIEAIKLFEAGVDQICDYVWVSDASSEAQMTRLMQGRKLTEQEASLRLALQTSQSEKRKMADVVINTEGSFYETWEQVINALNDTIHLQDEFFSLNLNNPNGLIMRPAGRVPTKDLATFWEKQTHQPQDALYELLGLQLITTLLKEQQAKALLFWQSYNFSAVLNQVITTSDASWSSDTIVEAFERQSLDQQCEICMIPFNVPKTCEINPAKAWFILQPVDEIIFPHWQTATQVITQSSKDEVWVKLVNQTGKDLAKKAKN